MDETNNLILNLITKNSSDNERTSLRSKLKNIGGGWKEKKKFRKFLKKEIQNNSTDKQKFLQKSTTANNNNSIQETSQKNLLNKTQIISSIFSYNPEIPNVRYDNDSKPIDNKPSNAPIDGTSSFKSMGLDNDLVENMKNKLGVEKPTNIQSKAIPVLMSSINKNAEFDVIIQSETGSGKTLTYLLPIVHRLINITIDIQNNGLLSRSIGALAIILTPTRELATQVVSVLKCLINIPPSKLTLRRYLNHWIVIGNVIGGEKKQSEKARLRKGINILVCTPGRLLDHLQNTKSFLVKNLCWLILDEADRLLELGFEEALQSIIKILDEKTINSETKNQLFSSSKFWPKRRQTILCSATLKDDVKRLAGHTLFNPIFIGGKDDTSFIEEKNVKNTKFNTPNQLKQSYIITPAKLRIVTLTAILKSTFNAKQIGNLVNRKIIVFVSCCDSVDFHFDLFMNVGKFNELNLYDDKLLNNDQSISTIIPTKIFRLHGDLTQNVRKEIFNEFSRSNSGILFCTDVAARGLDLPDVAMIIQYDPPTELKDYVHRVGRTARLGKKGEAILFILPSEIEYINVLKSQEIFAEPVQVETLLKSLATQNKRNKNEYEAVAADIQLNFESYVLSNSKRVTLAQKAYSSHIRAYATHASMEKHIFHVKKLHLGHIAKSFGLREAPSNINNNLISSKKLDDKNDHKKEKILNKEKKNSFDDQKNIKKRNFEIMNEFSVGNYESMIGPTTKRKRKGNRINKKLSSI